MSLAFGVPVTPVYNGIDLDFYCPTPVDPPQVVATSGGASDDPSTTVPEQSIPPARNSRFLFLGRYTPEKGALEAIHLCRRLRQPLDLYGDTTIVGSNNYVAKCRDAADGVLIRWYDGVSREKAVDLYRSYRALLMPINWQEPFGLVAIEAQACGMPVLALSKGALREIVHDGRTGFVRQTLDDLETILKSGQLASIKSKDCSEWAGKFSVQRMSEVYLTIFERVLQGNTW